MKVVKDLKDLGRISRTFKPISLRRDSALRRRWNLVPQLVSFEKQGMPLGEVAGRLGVPLGEVNLVRIALRHHKHKGFLSAIKSRKKWVKKKPKKEVISPEEQARLDAETERINTANAVFFYQDELIRMINGKESLKELNLTTSERHILQRYDLVSSQRGGTITKKAVQMLEELGRLPG